MNRRDFFKGLIGSLVGLLPFLQSKSFDWKDAYPIAKYSREYLPVQYGGHQDVESITFIDADNFTITVDGGGELISTTTVFLVEDTGENDGYILPSEHAATTIHLLRT